MLTLFEFSTRGVDFDLFGLAFDLAYKETHADASNFGNLIGFVPYRTAEFLSFFNNG